VTCLEVPGGSTGAHLVHPQRSRHQWEYPSVVDRREDEGRRQALPM
jgi:hypothetical protein